MEVGRILGRSWKNIGQKLEEYWAEVGRIFGGSWKNIGLNLEEFWVKVRRILDIRKDT